MNHADQKRDAIRSRLGESREWSASEGVSMPAWEMDSYHLVWDGGSNTDAALRRLWTAKKGNRPYPVVALTQADDADKVRVVGPQQPNPVREILFDAVLDLLVECRSYTQRSAASTLAREFARLEESVVPGVRVKDLLTPYFVRERLEWPVNKDKLEDSIVSLAGARINSGTSWRALFNQLGYQIQELSLRGYLLRFDGAPIAVIHPLQNAEMFNRFDDKGQLPEGVLLADCEKYGASWGLLIAQGRIRLFRYNPAVGSAANRHIEFDLDDIRAGDRFYLGLLAPDSLRNGGHFGEWMTEAQDFGEELRRGLEERLIKDTLPNIARGLGARLESQGADLSDREQLRAIEEAALTLVFRFMFLLHTEARGYLPVSSPAYRPHSARSLADESRATSANADQASTALWDRLKTLVRMVRNGNSAAGVPAYNGSLFAADGFPGGAMLEDAEIADNFLAPALASIAYETDKSDAPGLDFAGLQIGHLGAIYEALLSLRLTRATEDLAYDTRRDVFRPMRAGEQPEVTRAQLFYQAEAGGRKAGGVYYTRSEFVRHLLNHSLIPALDDHFERVRETAKTDPAAAARQLFDFSVVDPAMGSAHFLTAALDMMTDRIEIFLANVEGGLPGVAELLSELREQSADSDSSPEDGDLLRRLILKRCIYGVDLSPMAVEVANVTLWLASFVPGLALSYLGSNLKCGDALIGVATPDVVVNSNFDVSFFDNEVMTTMERAAELQRELAGIPDRTPAEVLQSYEKSTELRDASSGLRAAFDMWTADPLGVENSRSTLETYSNTILEGGSPKETAAKLLGNSRDEVDIRRVSIVEERLAAATASAELHRFFHWPLEFPNVFHRKQEGFDVVVGNPPWNEVTVEELGFYALREPGLKGLPNLAERRKRIAEIDQSHPEYREEFNALSAELKKLRGFFSTQGGYQLQGVGDKDLYQLFCERYTQLVRQDGRLGVVLPRTAFLAKGCERFRQWLFGQNVVTNVNFILNSARWAFDMEPRYTVSFLTSERRDPTERDSFQVTGPSTNLKEFEEVVHTDGVKIASSSLGSSHIVPLITSQSHADILSKLRRGAELKNFANPKFPKNRKGRAAASRLFPYTELHETQQRALFAHPQGEPVWKGRSFNQYDPHGREPVGYCDWDETFSFVQEKRRHSPIFRRMFSSDVLADPNTHPIRHCRIAFRDIARSTDSRTVIACLLPPKTPLTNKAPYLIFSEWSALAQSSVLAVMNSVPFDWIARRYIETNLNFFILEMLTFPDPENTPWERIGTLAARLSCVDERFADFAAEAGVEYGPLTGAERNDKRAEIDALVAHAYDLTADELRFIFTDFTENAVSPAYRRLTLDKFEEIGATV